MTTANFHLTKKEAADVFNRLVKKLTDRQQREEIDDLDLLDWFFNEQDTVPAKALDEKGRGIHHAKPVG